MDGHVEPVAEADAFDLQIFLGQRELVVEAGEPGRIGVERVPEEGRQPLRHRLGIVVAPGDDQRGDRIERVEQEMRVELVAERLELRCLCGLVGLGEAPLLRDRGAPGVIDVEQHHVRAEHQDIVQHRGIGAHEIGWQRLPGGRDMIADPALEKQVEHRVDRRRRDHGTGAQRQSHPGRHRHRRARGEIHQHRQHDRIEEG